MSEESLIEELKRRGQSDPHAAQVDMPMAHSAAAVKKETSTGAFQALVS